MSRRRLFHLAELDATPEFTSGLIAHIRREPSSAPDRTRSSLEQTVQLPRVRRPKDLLAPTGGREPQGVARAEAGNICALCVARAEFNFVETRREHGAIGRSAIQIRRRSKCAGIFRPLRQDAACHRKLRQTARSWPPWRGWIRPSNPPSGTPSSLPRKRRTPSLRGVCRRRSGWRKGCAERRNDSAPCQLCLHRTREAGSHRRDRSRTRPSRSGQHRLLPPAPGPRAIRRSAAGIAQDPMRRRGTTSR
jgi:hypothetical protein